jgi:hypothetical protein
VLDHLDRSATNRIAAALDPLRDDNGRHPTPATDTGADVTEHGARGSIATRLQIHRRPRRRGSFASKNCRTLDVAPRRSGRACLAIRALKSPAPPEDPKAVCSLASRGYGKPATGARWRAFTSVGFLRLAFDQRPNGVAGSKGAKHLADGAEAHVWLIQGSDDDRRSREARVAGLQHRGRELRSGPSPSRPAEHPHPAPKGRGRGTEPAARRDRPLHARPCRGFRLRRSPVGCDASTPRAGPTERAARRFRTRRIGRNR